MDQGKVGWGGVIRGGGGGGGGLVVLPGGCPWKITVQGEFLAISAVDGCVE